MHTRTRSPYEYDLLWDELCLDHKSYFAESSIYLDAEL